MATLRTTPNFRAPTITQQELDTLRVSGMNSLTRGYEAGRLGTEANTALAQEATLRADGRVAEADVLAEQTRGLRLRQGTIGPRVQRVEDIGSLGDAGSWAAGMVGQGVASMQDPVAAGTLAAGAGTALSFVPNPVAKAVGQGLRTVGAFAAPYAINQEQLKGEFYGQAKDDPEIMARYNAQQLNTAANTYGLAAGAMDSVVPGIVGRGLGGAGLRAGIAATGPLTRAAMSMAGEGLTETGQGELSRFTRSAMNPSRDTSGDMMERVNEFAGGAVGAGPFATAGALADSGYRRAGAIADGTADFVKAKAGQVTDLYDGSIVQRGVESATNKAKGLLSRGKDEVIDLATGEDGTMSARELAKNLRDKTQEGVDFLRQKQEERDVLTGMPPEGMNLDGPEFEAWFHENENKRAELISTRLSEMIDKGDPRAQELLQRGFGEGVTPEDQLRAMDEAAQLILETSNLEAFIKQAERGGGMAAKGADIAGRIARRAAEGVGTLGKAAWDGFKSGSKKNLQTISDQEMEANRNPQTGEVLKGGRGDQFDADAAYNRNVLEDGYAVAEKKRDSLRRAQLMGEYLAEMTKAEAPRYLAHRADVNVDNLASFMGDMGAEIADIAESWTARTETKGTEKTPEGPTTILRAPSNGKNQFDNLKLNLNRIANSLNNAFGGAAKPAVAELRTMATPESAPFFDYLEAEVDTIQSKRGAQETAKTRREAQDAVVSAIDPATRTKLLQQGINLNTPAGKRQLLGMAEAIASGRVAPGFDKALAGVIGRDNLDAILDTVAPIPVEEEYLNDAEVATTDTGLEMDDDGEMREAVASANAVEKNDAERLLAKGSGGKIYGFYDLRGLRGDVGIKDPFRPAARTTKDQALNNEAVSRQRAAEGLDTGAGKRPRLIPLDKEGADAGARARVEKALKVDRTPERMLAILKQEEKAALSSRTDASRAGPVRETRAVAAVEKAIAQSKAGDIKSQEWLNDRMEAFFLNRAGSWRVETKTAADVLREMNSQPARIIALYRDYLRDDAMRIAKAQPERATEMGQRAAQANQMVMDLMDKNEKKGALRLTPRQRRAIMDDARSYFESHGLVVAERLSNQDPAEIAPDIVLDMHKEGTKVADQVRGKKRDVKDVNMLVFKSDLTDGKELYVPVGKLVRLVRERRAMTEPVSFEANQESQSNQAKNQRYARDVMEGIAMLVGGGHVDGLPTMFGTGQTFEKGLPDSLRLATSTVHDMNFGAKQRLKNAKPQKPLTPEQEAERAAAYQEKVARDQARGEDPFTPEDRVERDPAGGYSPTSTRQREAAERLMARLTAEWGDDSKTLLAEYNAQAPNATSSEQFTERQMLTGMASETATRDGKPILRTSNVRTDRTGTVDPGAKSTDPKYAGQLARQRVKPDDATPLDVTDGQQGTVMDDFTEQRMRSVSQGYNAGVAETRAYPKGRMGDQGEFRGRELSSLMGTDVDAGMADAKLWLRMAKSPAYDAKGATGGAHLAMPVAYALNPERMALYDLGPTQAKEAQAMRVEVVRIVKDSSLRPADKLKILKQVAAPEHAAKLNAMNMRAYMENVAKRDATVDLGGTKAAPKTRAQIDAESTKAVEAFQAKQASAKEAEAPVGKSQPPAGGRKLNAQVAGTEYVSLDEIAERGDDANSPWLMADGRVLITFGDHMVAFGDSDNTYSDFMRRTGAVRASFFHDPIEKTFVAMLHRHEGQKFTPAQLASLQYLSRKQGGMMTIMEGAKDGRRNPEYSPSSLDTIAKNVSDKPLNAQDSRKGAGQRATPEQIQQAKDYVKKVLGPQIKVDFQDITGYSGEWIDATETIVISTTAAAGTMQTAYHEALHAFFGRLVKNEPKVFEVLKTLAEDQKVGERVLALLDGYPAAQQQYLTSGEERLAYIYQFWAAGELDLPGKPQNLLQKLVRFFRQVLGRITDSERATAVFEAFHEGALADPSVAGKVLAKKVSEGTLTTRQLRKVDSAVQKLRSFVLPAQSILGTSDSATARTLATEFWTNPGEEADGEAGEGYINAREAMSRRYNNMLGDALRGLSDRDLKDVARLLQQRADPATIAYTPHREAVKNVRKLLQRFYRYMTDERGVELGHLGDDYFPRVWSPYELGSKQEQFVQMLLTKYDDKMQEAVVASGGKVTKEEVARRIFAAIFGNQVVADHKLPDRNDGVLTPFFASKNNRVLTWIDDKDAEPFLNKDLIGILSQYFHNGARAAEYTARFGQHGEQLDTMLATVQTELAEAAELRKRRGEFKDNKSRDLWAQRQYEQVVKSIGAMEGTLGNDIGSTWRETNTWVTVYQNIRLLPLALFASVVDPLGMVARGASFNEAYDTFLRGIKEVGATWGDLFRTQPKERAVDQWERLALAVGSVDAAMFSHHVADEYASVYMSKRAKKLNDKFFQLNGMEAWNRGMRIGATKSAALFIARHSKLPDAHSARWLKELGLTKADITLDANGDLIADKNLLMAAKGITKQQAEQEIDKIHYAINRWVQGAILTPNAAQRPAWSSDPHYSMFFHLKQFSYSFHQTVLKRAVNEMGHGNLGPMGAFIWYIPMMIAADLTKGLLQGGGELPAHMKGMNAGDWIMRGAERAGLLGVGQIGVDAGQDIWSIGGPAVEQIMDGFTKPLNETTLRALPANSLYTEALK